MRLVLDASVAIEWFLPSLDQVIAIRARELLERGKSMEVEFIVPDSFWVEVGSVFARAVRRRAWAAHDVSSALATLEQAPILTEPIQPFLPSAMNIALSHQQAVYDTLYVAIAIDRQVEMVTADLRLYNDLGSRFPIRWLGGWIAKR